MYPIVRRGVMSLRVVLQMLSWLRESYTCGDDTFLTFYPLILVTAFETHRHPGV